MSNHTPGPWIQAKHSPADVIVGGNTMIATARDGLNGIDREQAVANARLIAAAPELLTALQALLDGAVRHEVRDGYEAHYPEIAAARAVIAKATNSAK